MSRTGGRVLQCVRSLLSVRALDEWLAWSVRRVELDKDLCKAMAYMRGHVLEIGASASRRRGQFRPPIEACRSWIYVDINEGARPHIVGDLEQLPVRDGGFDTVVCLEVLEYVESPSRAVREIRRVLAPGGHMVLATPFLSRRDTPHDFWRFTDEGLRFLLERAGFEVVLLARQGGALGVVVNVLKHIIWVESRTWRRRAEGYLLRPLLSWLWRLDSCSSIRRPILSGFATGYLVVTRRPGCAE